MYYKIENKSFWTNICKRIDDIYSVINIIIEILERFTIQNFTKVSSFIYANCIIKYNRIFLVCSKEKIFTLNFPFTIVEGGVLFDGEIVDIDIIQAMKMVIEIIEKSSSYEDFLIEYDAIDESYGFKVEVIQIASKFLKKLFEIEIGYLRYDRDEKASEKNGEEYHPEHHLDIFISNSMYDISSKIGIDREYSRDIENIFDKLFNQKEKSFFLK